MASYQIPSANADSSERPITREESWQLFHSLRGILKESYAKLGGAEQFHRKERQAWTKASDSE